MQIFRLLIPVVVAFSLYGCGGQKESTRVTNNDGNYSIEVLPGWIHEIDGTITRISRFQTIDVEEVSGTLMVSEIVTSYDDLDKNFESQVPALYTLDNFRKVSDGRTQINGAPSRWIRLNDSENDIQYTTIQYLMQRPGNKCIILNCSSTAKNFAIFEEELNKMVFSLILNR